MLKYSTDAYIPPKAVDKNVSYCYFNIVFNRFFPIGMILNHTQICSGIFGSGVRYVKFPEN